MTVLLTLGILSVPEAVFSGTDVERIPESDETGARTDFINVICNLGLFSSSDSIKTASIVLHNIGRSTLEISGTETTCSCTSVTISDSTIVAGDSASVFVTYNSTGKWPGVVNQAARISSNAVNSPVSIRITGFMYETSTVPDSTTIADWPVTDTPQIKLYQECFTQP
ncbi:MAG: DUF1573 domain-containing protein [Bacteroidaceae bacterium]|nr:DUF1573 domain-containing protein [Bacteroidaceae bacterium]